MPRAWIAAARVLLCAALLGCPDDSSRQDARPGVLAPDGKSGWLQGSTDERFARVEKHLRGFDVAMVETGYRYSELYFAGQDRNWGYADYQLGKIETAIRNGLERRPLRAASAQMLEEPIQAVRAAIQAEDPAGFESAFVSLTALCNACHQAEQVAFMTVQTPTIRLTTIRGAEPPADPSGR
jgi:cytochrome c556